MNLDEYRAMVAEEANQPETVVDTEGATPNVQTDESTITPAEQTIQAPHETGSVSEPNPIETVAPAIPSTIEVDGQQVPVEELTQGYLRQSDYTKKTQEIARIKQQAEVAQKYFDAIHSDPEFAEGIARRFELPFMTPEQIKVQELEHNYNTLLIERDIERLQAKYPDFDAEQALRTATTKQISNLEDAYLLSKPATATTPALDIDTIKEQIRQELLTELQSNVDTTTIIGSGGSATQVQSNAPVLSAQEMRVAQHMKMTAAEYAKWRDA